MSHGGDGWWTYKAGGKVIGPVTSTDLKKLVAAGVVTPWTKVQHGDGQWVEAAQLADLVPLFMSAQRSDQPGAPRYRRVAGRGEASSVAARGITEPEPAPTRGRPGSAERRQFESLQTVAGITDWFAGLYVVLAVIGTLGFIGFCFAGGAEAVFVGLVGGATYLLCMLMATAFIGAMAEGIRLVLYAVELLEDIRDSRG